ncbi:DUF3365 domain-containing protein [Myxococcota bacterium]|nr:DUF3365 domain-containing protein [Myxococcota bacterium]
MTLILLSSFLLAACGEAPQAPGPEVAALTPPPAPPEKVDPKADALALAKATDAGARLGAALKGRLTQAMVEGPGAAMTACSDEAQGLTAQVRGESGVRVGRASLKLRNPTNSGPDWVQAWLTANEGKPGAEAALSSEVTTTPDGRFARVIRPITVEAGCLTCHGDPAAIPPPVKEQLTARYPGDAATGYKVGDLRGAIWAELAVKPAAEPAADPATAPAAPDPAAPPQEG